MKASEFDKTFKGLSDFIKDKDILLWYYDLIKIAIEDEAIAFAEWLELNGYKIKGMDDGQREKIYKLFIESQL